jgi:alkylhydroperoxidase family enzyme
MKTVDALIDRKRLSDGEFPTLSAHFAADQILEVIQLTAFYTGVSMICGALDLEAKPGTPALPKEDTLT